MRLILSSILSNLLQNFWYWQEPIPDRFFWYCTVLRDDTVIDRLINTCIWHLILTKVQSPPVSASALGPIKPNFHLSSSSVSPLQTFIKENYHFQPLFETQRESVDNYGTGLVYGIGHLPQYRNSAPFSSLCCLAYSNMWYCKVNRLLNNNFVSFWLQRHRNLWGMATLEW